MTDESHRAVPKRVHATILVDAALGVREIGM